MLDQINDWTNIILNEIRHERDEHELGLKIRDIILASYIAGVAKAATMTTDQLNESKKH